MITVTGRRNISRQTRNTVRLTITSPFFVGIFRNICCVAADGDFSTTYIIL